MDAPQNELIRDVFHALLRRYFLTVGPSGRRFIEVLCVLQVLVCFSCLSLLHHYYASSPPNCLANQTGNWSGDGILRVEVKYKRNEVKAVLGCRATDNWTEKSHENKSLPQPGFKERHGYFYGPLPLHQDRQLKNLLGPLEGQQDEVRNEGTRRKGGAVHSVLPWSLAILGEVEDEEAGGRGLADNESPKDTGSVAVMEYALEYGYLHLSRAARQKLNLTITTVTLDPSEVPCFGPALPRLLLQFTYGFDILLLCSFQEASENLGPKSKGFLRNVFSGQYYHFVGVSVRENASLFVLIYSALLLIGSAIVLSVLLRLVMLYVPRLMMTFIEQFDRSAVAVGLVHVLVLNLAITSITLVLSEFFSDPLAVDSLSTVIFFSCIVWAADIFNSCCCHAAVSKRYFGRFFYLIAYMFVVYHVRFKGLFSEMAQMTAWACIQYTMVFFIHRIELPAVIQMFWAERVHALAGGGNQSDNGNQFGHLTADNDADTSDSNEVTEGFESDEEHSEFERLPSDESDLDLRDNSEDVRKEYRDTLSHISISEGVVERTGVVAITADNSSLFQHLTAQLNTPRSCRRTVVLPPHFLTLIQEVS